MIGVAIGSDHSRSARDRHGIAEGVTCRAVRGAGVTITCGKQKSRTTVTVLAAAGADAPAGGTADER